MQGVLTSEPFDRFLKFEMLWKAYDQQNLLDNLIYWKSGLLPNNFASIRPGLGGLYGLLALHLGHIWGPRVPKNPDSLSICMKNTSKHAVLGIFDCFWPFFPCLSARRPRKMKALNKNLLEP